jgi:hypothetical protein
MVMFGGDDDDGVIILCAKVRMERYLLSADY